MKKLFLVLAAAFVMVACQTDINEVGVVADGVATVEFEVGAPQMRSFSDGMTANKLQYAVYEVKADKSLNYLQNLTVAGDEAKTLVNGAANVKIELANNKKYAVIFWASAAVNAPYTFNPAEKTVTVDYNNAKCNDESRDAFYAYKEFEVKGAATLGVDLRRPFAQVNVGTSDLAEAAKSNFVPSTSALVVKNVFSTLNLVDGTATDNVAEVTFAADTVPAGEDFPYNKAEYKYLAMSYVLVGKDKGSYDVTYTITAGDNTVITNTIGAVPMQANYRTNIYGKLLTSTTDVNVEIKPGYEEPANGYYITEDGGVTTLHVTSMEGIEAIAEGVATGDSKWTDANIVLDTDLDLAATTRSVESNWTPIGTEAIPFTGSLDGNGNTIKNLTIVETEAKEGKAFIGFFGYANNATIKNVVFENVYINIPCLDIDHSQGHIGAVAGSLEGTSTIENVTVKGDIKVYATQNANGASRVAVIAGGNSYGNVTMENVHVIANDGSYLTANNNAGALAGQLQGKSVCKNCSSNIDVTVNKFFAGGLIGLAAGDQLFENCHTTGDVKVVAGREGRNHDQYRVGGIAGGWSDGKNNVCTLVGCSYTGEVSGKNSDGSVAESLDYLGYVGRGYTLNGCAGSKVVIDGISFVQVGNTAAEAGVYTVTNAEGEAVALVKNAEELETALEAGGELILANDIALTETLPVSNANFTLNGNGCTISQTAECTNTYALFDITGGKATIKNVVFDGIKEGAVVRTVGVEFLADGVTAQNGQHTQQQGLFRLMGKSTIKNSIFKNNSCKMVITLNYDGGNNDPQLIENCVFENNTCDATAVVYYVKGAGATINGNKFVGNTVTVSSGSNAATLYMGFTENNVITNNLFKNNTVNAGTSKRVSGGLMLGYEAIVSGNAFIGNKVNGENAKGNDVCASIYYTSIDLSGNYWGGNAPVENDDYFVEYPDRGNSVIVNDYLTENPIQ